MNVLAFRLTHGIDVVRPRSFCPHCQTQIAWYDLIPVISWLILGGRCRTCKQSISSLYPFIEILTAVMLTALWLYVPTTYLPGYTIFFSALIVTIRTDLEYMLISRAVTLYLVPIAVTLSALGKLPISLNMSMLGCMVGYGMLWSVATLFKKVSGKDGIGQGDLDLLAFIGSFTGVMGCWCALFLGSCLGSLAGLTVMLTQRSTATTKIPFGPFLALGAMSYVLFGTHITYILFGW